MLWVKWGRSDRGAVVQWLCYVHIAVVAVPLQHTVLERSHTKHRTRRLYSGGWCRTGARAAAANGTVRLATIQVYVPYIYVRTIHLCRCTGTDHRPDPV